MGVGVVFGRLTGVVRRVQTMAVRNVRVMGGLFMVSIGMMFSRFAVVGRSMFVMFCGFSVVFSSIVMVHRNILSRGVMCGRRTGPVPLGPSGIIYEFRYSLRIVAAASGD